LGNIVIFGNSGAGKSTLAKKLANQRALSHLDLDTIAWLPSTPPERMPLKGSQKEIEQFLSKNEQWVIEGCYSDLLELVVPYASELIFLNLPIQTCIDNAKKRPWEPHKYESKAAQDSNLTMLIEWIRQYETRTDTFSLTAHQHVFDRFDGKKSLYTANILFEELV